MVRANDRVIINDGGSILHQKQGVVVGHYPTASSIVLWIVLLDNDASRVRRLYFERELIVQEEQDGPRP